jgi:hypothetical protein
VDAFRQELRELEWIEGKNFTIEYWFGEQKNERPPLSAIKPPRICCLTPSSCSVVTLSSRRF